MRVSAVCMVSIHPHSRLANDVLGSRCVLMLYACCLQGSRPSLESYKTQLLKVPLALMCGLLFKGLLSHYVLV